MLATRCAARGIGGVGVAGGSWRLLTTWLALAKPRRAPNARAGGTFHRAHVQRWRGERHGDAYASALRNAAAARIRQQRCCMYAYGIAATRATSMPRWRTHLRAARCASTGAAFSAISFSCSAALLRQRTYNIPYFLRVCCLFGHLLPSIITACRRRCSLYHCCAATACRYACLLFTLACCLRARWRIVYWRLRGIRAWAQQRNALRIAAALALAAAPQPSRHLPLGASLLFCKKRLSRHIAPRRLLRSCAAVPWRHRRTMSTE
jgi:hypothetical protein